MNSAQRVAQRFVTARFKAVQALIVALIKSAGGARVLTKTMDSEMMLRWDKEQFYSLSDLDWMLESALNRNQEPKLVAKWLQQAWDRQHDQQLDFNENDIEVKWNEGKLNIDWEAEGGSWRPAPDGTDPQEDHDYYDEHSDEIDYDYNAGQLGMEIQSFIGGLGGSLSWLNDEQKDDPQGEFVFNRYRCRSTWKLKAEDILRSRAIDKLIDQAGKSVRWVGDPSDR